MATTLMLVPLVAAAALFMENMDATVIATSLPAIARDLHQDPVVLKLAFTSYLIALAVFIPVSGWAADRFGARNVFRGAIVLFTLASAACGARSLEWLVAARAAQGMGGAMMAPVGRLILLRSVPKSELVQALAYLTIPALLAPLIGPLLGGFITTYFHWRWIFWINIPVGVLGLVLATRYMPDVRADRVPPLDRVRLLPVGPWPGIAHLRLHRHRRHGAAAPLGAGAGRARRRADRPLDPACPPRPHPILDLKLFRIPTLRSSLVGGTVFRIGIGSIPFLLPLCCGSASASTLSISRPVDLRRRRRCIGDEGVTALPILRYFGFRRVLVFNALICAASSPSTACSRPIRRTLILVVLLTGGFFRSLQFTSLNALAFADVRGARPVAGDQHVGGGAAAVISMRRRARRLPARNHPGAARRLDAGDRRFLDRLHDHHELHRLFRLPPSPAWRRTPAPGRRPGAGW